MRENQIRSILLSSDDYLSTLIVLSLPPVFDPSAFFQSHPIMNKFSKIFSNSCNKMIGIGMVHLKCLPGAPRSVLSVDQVIEHAVTEAKVYRDHDLNGIMIENMNDVPYSLCPSHETATIMTRVATEIKREVKNIPLGVQVLASRNMEALAVALASDCEFIRVENFVYSHVADEGLVNSCASQLLRYQKNVSGESIAIVTDIKKKHSSHAITSDITISEAAKTAQFFLSDGLILTGTSTGDPVNISDVKEVATAGLQIPIIVGSGVNPENLPMLYKSGAQAVIVGSYFKKNGIWSNGLDAERIKKFIDVIHKCTNIY